MCRWSAQIREKNAEIQAFRDSYSKDGYDLMITIEGTRIRSYKNNAPDVDLRKNDVRGVFETERFFVFQLTGGILLPHGKKDAFIKGDVEACRNYIPELKEKIIFLFMQMSWVSPYPAQLNIYSLYTDASVNPSTLIDADVLPDSSL